MAAKGYWNRKDFFPKMKSLAALKKVCTLTMTLLILSGPSALPPCEATPLKTLEPGETPSADKITAPERPASLLAETQKELCNALVSLDSKLVDSIKRRTTKRGSGRGAIGSPVASFRICGRNTSKTQEI